MKGLVAVIVYQHIGLVGLGFLRCSRCTGVKGEVFLQRMKVFHYDVVDGIGVGLMMGGY